MKISLRFVDTGDANVIAVEEKPLYMCIISMPTKS